MFFDYVKKYPVFSLIISSFFAFSLGVAGSVTGSYIFEYLKNADINNELLEGSVDKRKNKVEVKPAMKLSNIEKTVNEQSKNKIEDKEAVELSNIEKTVN